jgi:DNA-binding IscR family transcriptional regulator
MIAAEDRHVIDDRIDPYFRVSNHLVKERVKEIGVYGFTVYCYLVMVAGQKRQCYPKRMTIANDLGISHPTVDKSLSALVNAGLIAIEPRFSEGKKPTSHLYRILQVVNDVSTVVNVVDNSCKSQIPTIGIQDLHKQDVVKQDAINNTPNGVRAPARKTRIADSWTTTEKEIQYAEDQGFSRQAISTMAEAFYQHFKASGEPKADWHATWCSWVLREHKYAARRR